MPFTFTATKRQPRGAEDLRSQGLIPAVLYGPEIEPIPVSVEYTAFEKLYDQAGESSLIDLSVDGCKEPIKVLIQEIQYDPVKGSIIHVDFRQIKMGEEMSATLTLNFVGESAAVKELGGTLFKGVDALNIRCLPKDLLGELEVDLGTLQTFDDVIRIADLKLPAGITVTDNPEILVAKVTPPLTEEQIKAMEEAEVKAVEEVEVEEKGKKEEEEGEEAAEGEKKEGEKKEEGGEEKPSTDAQAKAKEEKKD